MSKRGGKRPGSGRKAMGVKRINVMLSPNHVIKAYRLGNANVSRGVRKALDLACIERIANGLEEPTPT
jgi:hypothetical protein